MLQRQLFFISICFFLVNSLFAQQNFWFPVDFQDINMKKSIDNHFIISHKHYFSLDKSSLFTQLELAPNRHERVKSDLILNIPNHKGGFEPYQIFKTQTLSSQLAQKYPSINSYVGKSLDNGSNIIRLTTTPQGVYIMILSPNNGQFFINPVDDKGQYYMSFLKSDAYGLNQTDCKFEGQTYSPVNYSIPNNDQSLGIDEGFLRIYDFALACTGEYAQFQIEQAGLSDASQTDKIAAILAAMTVTLDRVNSIYERDLGVSMRLIPNNELLIFLDSEDDPYSNNSASTMLNENQITVDSTIGFENYDIGHVFGTGDVGIAILGSVCSNGLKAQGVTGSSSPTGDPFNIDYVAHEMGHQFGANHTQNNDCQRNSVTAVEPGSASTIMGYAGICEPNIQNFSDAYFHQVSIDEISTNITNSFGSTCGEFVGESNSAPVLTALPNYTIPYGTAFYLDVEATDAEDDVLSYNWEQIDNDESTQPPMSNSAQGPNFRSLPSKSDSRRYFPDFNSVLNNNLQPTWEVIPSIPRTMEFAVTVRDNNIQVGQTSTDFTTVTFVNAGPFQVTSQNTNDINWLPDENETITWDVAGTTSNGINTSEVNILLSIDGGENFDIILASNTPNDGIEDITVPSLKSSSCRIMIKPVDNIYYALNFSEFSIDTIIECENYTNESQMSIPDGVGDNQQGEMVESVINITEDFTNIDDINIKLDVTHTWINDLFIRLKNPNGDYITLWERNCNNQAGIDITLNDAGNALTSPGSDCDDLLTGIYAPKDTTTNLMNLFSSGTFGNWILEISDFWNQDTGMLNSWGIEICTSTFSIQENNLNDFSITPNPNQGSFDLNLSQPLNANSKMSIYDMQGRLVETIKPVLNALSQRVVLKNISQNGVYLLEVIDQHKKSVKKLIVK